MSASNDALCNGISDHSEEVELEARSERLEHLATACGALVVIGVILEYVPKLISLLPHWDWYAFVKDLLGGVLIALGVFFEILFGLVGSRVNSRIGKIKDQKIAEVNALAEKERTERMKLQIEIKQKISEAEYRAMSEAVKKIDERKKRSPYISS